MFHAQAYAPLHARRFSRIRAFLYPCHIPDPSHFSHLLFIYSSCMVLFSSPTASLRTVLLHFPSLYARSPAHLAYIIIAALAFLRFPCLSSTRCTPPSRRSHSFRVHMHLDRFFQFASPSRRRSPAVCIISSLFHPSVCIELPAQATPTSTPRSSSKLTSSGPHLVAHRLSSLSVCRIFRVRL